MRTRIKVIKKAEDISLVSVYDVKTALGLAPTDKSRDDQIELLIKWASGEISTLCNRVFAQETVEESFRDLPGISGDLYLSHWPIQQITSVTDNGLALTEDADFEVDARPGKLCSLNGSWSGAVIVSYIGGYLLPHDAPETLMQASMLLTKEAYYALIRGDSTVRMIGHKESRIMYFDPNLALRAAGGGGAATPGSGSVGSPTRKAVQDLLRHYMRFQI